MQVDATSTPEDDRRGRLDAIFATVAVGARAQPERQAVRDARIALLIDTLLLLSRPSQFTPPHPASYRHIGKRQSDINLRAIVHHAAPLAELLAGLSATDIGRLADVGLMRSDMPSVASLAQLALSASNSS